MEYVDPIVKIHSSFAEAKKFFDDYGLVDFFGDDEKKLTLGELVQGSRNLIVGEPGVGKSLLLERIRDHLAQGGTDVRLIELRQPTAAALIDSFLGTTATAPRALLLDGFDEVRSSDLAAILQKIEAVAAENPEVSIYLSARWIFVTRQVPQFSSYRYITISPFTQRQVREYLIRSRHSESDVDKLLKLVMAPGHSVHVLQIPRYLAYLEKFLDQRGVASAAAASRNELFEYLTYAGLEVEDVKFSTDRKDIIKRVLEKLALVMEIYQTNVITKDDLMTFFDRLDSDLKRAMLSQVSPEVFYEKSLLKNNGDTIEFSNSEFQEYLAAKEITRFADPSRAAFGFMVDPDAEEIYPSWFNTLSFLVDMRQELLEQLIEFSRIRGEGFRVVDEALLSFLSRVDPRSVPADSRQRLFVDVVAYHRRVRQWIPGELASALPGFFDASLEAALKSGVTAAELEEGAKRFVPLGNSAYIVGYLLRSGATLDSAYWRRKLLGWVGDGNDNGVLQRRALFALGELGDKSVVPELPDLMGASELVVQEFLTACRKLDPNSPKSLEHFLTAIREDNLSGRYGLYEATEAVAIKEFLRTFNADEGFRRQFLDDVSIFKDQDKILVAHIAAVLDDEIVELCKDAVAWSVAHNVGHEAERSSFIIGLWKLLRERSPNLVAEMAERIKAVTGSTTGLYFAHGFFAEVIEKEDVPAYLDTMIAAGEKYSAFSTMARIKSSRRVDADEVFEAGRSRLAEDYSKWDERRAAAAGDPAKQQNEQLLREFRLLLQPQPGAYGDTVFEFYNNNADRLDLILGAEDRERLVKLLTGTVLKFVEPLAHPLIITEEHEGAQTYRTSSAIHIYRDALIAANRLGVDPEPFRQQIINFIPFAYERELQAIFALIKDVRPAEMAQVLDVYRRRSGDLWRHQLSSFIEAVERYHITTAAPILRGLVSEPLCDRYTRRRALTVADSLAPDPASLQEIFSRYESSADQSERQLAGTANELLIAKHSNAEAVKWRLHQIAQRAAAFIPPQGVHSVSDLEDEITHGRSFARPLRELGHPGYQEDYLWLLDQAMAIWARGSSYHAYAGYVWEVVYSYFDNLKVGGTYSPLRLLEERVARMQDLEGANWLAGRIANLRRSYLDYVGKPRGIAEAVAHYNAAQAREDKKIIDSSDLFRHIQNVVDTDLKDWIEGEGGYDLIRNSKPPRDKQQRNEHEKLIQRTLVTEIKYSLGKRGFSHATVLRESQLLDGKRADILVRHGFVGPIVIEVKLSSNKDIRGSKIDQSPSYLSMQRYMRGFGAQHGILLVINNQDAKYLRAVKNVFQSIPNVWVQFIDCARPSPASKPRKRVPAARRRRASVRGRSARTRVRK